MGLPRPETHPAEVCPTADVPADHVVAPAVLLDGSLALGALLGVGRDPVGGLRVVVALLDPPLDERAADGVVPVLGAGEAEEVAALALDRAGLNLEEQGRCG